MAFDPDTLRPLYKLELGKAGRSCALLIAKRLGLEDSILARAAEVCGSNVPKAAPELPAERTVVMPKAPEVKPPQQPAAPKKPRHVFEGGESVYVHQLHRTGIVAQEANAKGEVVVKVADRKYNINQKRLSPHLKKEDLYPDHENYDLDIVLDTVQNRKNKHKMNKRHVEGAVVTITDDKIEKL